MITLEITETTPVGRKLYELSSAVGIDPATLASALIQVACSTRQGTSQTRAFDTTTRKALPAPSTK